MNALDMAIPLVSTTVLMGLITPLAAAGGGEHDSEGVLVTVEVGPLECAARCLRGLPATGLDFQPLVVWVAGVLIVTGFVMLLWRRHTRRGARHV